jgi:hypothetical protein
VIDKANPRFWEAFAKLPREIQELARKKHHLWLVNPHHPSLHFKELTEGLWSVRINAQYRALARRKGEFVLWIWIGPHAEYDRLIEG